MKNKINFTVKIDDKDVELAVERPDARRLKQASLEHGKAFGQAIRAGLLTREQARKLFMEQEDEITKDKFSKLEKEIIRLSVELKKGGKTISEGKQLALELKEKRTELQNLNLSRSSYDAETADGIADNARFDYLISACTVYKETGKPYFKNVEDYLDRSDEAVALLAASHLLNIMYDIDNNEDNLPENAFLKEHGFVDDKLRLINKEGKLVDREGRLINEQGRYINENGELVDIYGNRVDEAGNYLDKKPFVDG